METIYLDLRERMCFGFLHYGCQPHESGSLKLFDKVVDNKSIVIDVGANLGYYTLYSSKIAGGIYI